MFFKRRLSFIVKIFLFLAICLSGSSVFSFYSLIYKQNTRTEPTMILIEKGDSLDRIARRLKTDGLIDSVSVFKLAGRLGGNATHLKAGEYRIPPKASPKLILEILTSGQTIVRRLTIPEGLTSAQTIDMLMDTAALFGDLKDVPPNGTLLPETYVFAYGTPRKVIFDRMAEGMTKTIEELWPDRNPDLPYTTKEEALVMASIVEKETSLSSERPRIAGVFVNRLRKGMRLQTDPTVIYAVTNGSMKLNRLLTYSDLKKDHPFNTYTRKGLPPAPICNPGRESIAAALNPQKTNELYFVADGTGGHVFARTFDEHRANIAAWKRALRAKKNKKKAVAAQKVEKTVSPVTSPSAPVADMTTDEALEQAKEALITLEETLSEHDAVETPVISNESVLPKASAPVEAPVVPATVTPVESAKKAVQTVTKKAPSKKTVAPKTKKKSAASTKRKKTRKK